MNRKQLALSLALIGATGAALAQSNLNVTVKLDEPTTAPAAAEPAVKHDEKALAVIDGYLEKIGGKDLIASIQSTKMEASVEIPMAGITGTMMVSNKAPGKMAMVMDLPGFGKTESGYDGEVGWSSDPMNGPRLMTDEEISDMGSQADPNAAVKYRENYATIEHAGEVDFNGQKANKIRLVRANGRESFEFYALDTGLMIGQESVQASPMGEIKIVTFLGDYKEFGGMKAPTTMTQNFGPQKLIMKITSMEINSVDDAVFTRPAAVDQLVKAKKSE